MKALVIAPQPFFSPRGTPFSVYYRTLITAQLGADIDLLTYGEGQDINVPNVRTIRISRFKAMGNVKVGPSYLKLFLDVFLMGRLIALLIRNKYDFVHAHEEAVFMCWLLKPIFRFKLIYDMHSSLPQQLTNFKFTQSKFFIRLFKTLEDSCLHISDAVITICPDLADHVNKLMPNSRKHFLIENSIFVPVKLLEDTKTKKKPNDVNFHERNIAQITLPKNKRFLVYAGTLEPYQGIGILIDAFKKVIKEISDAYLIIVGGNQRQVEEYSNHAEEIGIKEILFTGQVPQHLAIYYNSIASVLISPRSEGTNTPLKIYEQLASGIPLVATDIYSHTQVLNNDVCFLVKPNSVDMSKGIIRALKENDQARKKAENARKMYNEKYSRPIYMNKMKKMLKVLV